jgi:DNA-binding CsgD family transcriptional regulator
LNPGATFGTVGEAAFDGIVHDIYRAGAGLCGWVEPLKKIEKAFDAWLVQFLGFDKKTGRVKFSHDAGVAPRECSAALAERFPAIDPAMSLLFGLPEGAWFSCEEHFGDAGAAQNPFFRDFLIPYGGRYLFAGKIYEDEGQILIVAILHPTGGQPLREAGRSQFRRIATHLLKAFHMRRPSEAALDPERISALYGLSAAQARIAAKLATGMPPKRIAQSLDIAYSTVRSQMKVIFVRTRTHRQAELVRMLMQAPMTH